MNRLIRPVDPTKIKYPDDVAILRAAINRENVDASDVDIQEAYQQWSEATYSAGWVAVDDATTATFVDAVMDTDDYLIADPDW